MQELIRSADQGIRAARVLVTSSNGKKSALKRPIQHLYPLEVVEKTPESQKTPEENPPDQITSEEQGAQPEREPPTPEPPNLGLRPKRAAAQKARARIRDLQEQI